MSAQTADDGPVLEGLKLPIREPKARRYFLNLVLIDEEDRRYFKQQEIILWRKADKYKSKQERSDHMQVYEPTTLTNTSTTSTQNNFNSRSSNNNNNSNDSNTYSNNNNNNSSQHDENNKIGSSSSNKNNRNKILDHNFFLVFVHTF